MVTIAMFCRLADVSLTASHAQMTAGYGAQCWGVRRTAFFCAPGVSYTLFYARSDAKQGLL